MTEQVLLSSGDTVRVITLNRPERLNAFNSELWCALLGALERAATDPAVKVVVLTGAGRAFTAGQDLGELTDMVDEGEDNPPARLMRLLIDYPVPLVTAVNGVAAGFGLGLVVHSDLVVMAESARLGAPFVGIGLAMDAGMSELLPRRIGYARAARLLFTAGWLDADEAVTSGLALAKAPDGEALATAITEAEQIARHPRTALVASKRLLVEARRAAVSAALGREQEVLAELSQGEEHRQAVRAFLDRSAAR